MTSKLSVLSQRKTIGGIFFFSVLLVLFTCSKLIFEPNHNTSLSAATANPPHPKTCKVNEWQCANKVQCILISNVCNGRLNCADGSDETFGCDLDITDTGCKSWGQVTHVRCVTRPDEGICTLPEYKNSTCRKCNGKGNKWRCDDGQCIDEAKRFNGYPDCIDASDEFVDHTPYIWTFVVFSCLFILITPSMAIFIDKKKCQDCKLNPFSCSHCCSHPSKDPGDAEIQEVAADSEPLIELLRSSELPREDIVKGKPNTLIKILTNLSENDSNVKAEQMYRSVRKNSRLYQELYTHFYHSYSKHHPIRAKVFSQLIEWEKRLDATNEIVRFWQLHFGNSALFRFLVRRLESSQSNVCGTKNEKVLYKCCDCSSFSRFFGFVFTGWLKFYYLELFVQMTFTIMIANFMNAVTKDTTVKQYFFEYALLYTFIICPSLVQLLTLCLSMIGVFWAKGSDELYGPCSHKTRPEKKSVSWWLAEGLTKILSLPITPAIVTSQLKLEVQKVKASKKQPGVGRPYECLKEQTGRILHWRQYNSCFHAIQATIQSMCMIICLTSIYCVVSEDPRREIDLAKGLYFQFSSIWRWSVNSHEDAKFFDASGLMAFTICMGMSFFRIVYVLYKSSYESVICELAKCKVASKWLKLFFLIYTTTQVYIKLSLPVNIIVQTVLGKGTAENVIIFGIYIFVSTLHICFIYVVKAHNISEFTKASLVEQINHVLVNTILVTRFKPADDLSLLNPNSDTTDDQEEIQNPMDPNVKEKYFEKIWNLYHKNIATGKEMLQIETVLSDIGTEVPSEDKLAVQTLFNVMEKEKWINGNLFIRNQEWKKHDILLHIPELFYLALQICTWMKPKHYLPWSYFLAASLIGKGCHLLAMLICNWEWICDQRKSCWHWCLKSCTRREKADEEHYSECMPTENENLLQVIVPLSRSDEVQHGQQDGNNRLRHLTLHNMKLRIKNTQLQEKISRLQHELAEKNESLLEHRLKEAKNDEERARIQREMKEQSEKLRLEQEQDGSILIASGWNGKCASAMVELVDKTCRSKPFLPLPCGILYGTGGFLSNQVIICGGITGPDKCWKLSQDGMTWQQFATLDEKRDYGSSVILEQKIWIHSGNLTSSLLVDINGKITNGPDLPKSLVGSTTIRVFDQIMVIGGRSNGTRIYNLKPSFVKEGPSLNVSRAFHGCCSVLNHEGRSVIIVAGGLSDEACKSAELLDHSMADSSWQRIKDLPVEMRHKPAMHPHPDGDGVIIIHDNHAYKLNMQNGDYRYEPLNCQLQHPRNAFVSMMIPSKFVKNLATFSGGHILLIGGWFGRGWWRGASSAKAEIVDKFGNSKALPNLPHEARSATGGFFMGQPFLCGGNTGPYGTYHTKCFKLSVDGLSWQEFGPLDEPRSYTSSVILQEKIWISGGAKGEKEDDVFKSSVLLDFNGGVNRGPYLHEPLFGHASISIQDMVMVTGGHNGKNFTNSTRIYNMEPSFVKDGPPLNVGRYFHGSCSVASCNHEGRNVIIVAGGYNSEACKSVEVWDHGKPGTSWERIKDLPVKMMSSPALLPHPDGDGITIIYEKHSFKLIMKNGEYIYQPLNYKQHDPRRRCVAMMVPDQFVESLPKPI